MAVECGHRRVDRAVAVSGRRTRRVGAERPLQPVEFVVHGITSLPAIERAQPLARLVHAPRHGGLGDAQHLGGFRVPQPLLDHQGHRRSQIGAEHLQHLAQPDGLVLALALCGPGQGVDLGECLLVAPPRAVAPQAVARGIDHHPIEPGREPALAPPGGEPGGQAHADILRKVPPRRPRRQARARPPGRSARSGARGAPRTHRGPRPRPCRPAHRRCPRSSGHNRPRVVPPREV